MRRFFFVIVALTVVFLVACESSAPAYRNTKHSFEQNTTLSSIAEFINSSRDFYGQTVLPEARFSYCKTGDIENASEYLALVDSFVEKRFCLSYAKPFSENDLKQLLTESLYVSTKGYFDELYNDILREKVVFFPREATINSGAIVKIFEQDGAYLGINAFVNFSARTNETFLEYHENFRAGANFAWLWIYFNEEMQIVGWSEVYNDIGVLYFGDTLQEVA